MLAYLAGWATLCLFALLLVVREPAAYALTQGSYLRSLLIPWKLASFAVATAFFVIAAPHSGDPTWDWLDSLLMSLLTFATAPFAVGTIYRVARGRLPRRQIVVAACAWMLSASWCYDLYILIRDGVYPSSWLANLAASSVLYASGGLMWSLTFVCGRGVVFAFQLETWPAVEDRGAGGWRVLAVALLFMLLVAALMLPFVCEPWSGAAG